MQEKKRKFPLTPLETILLAILTPIIYVGGFMSLVVWQKRSYPDFFENNPYGLSYFIVLGFDAVWIVLMKLWPYRNIKVKVVLTLLVFILSALVLTDLFITGVFNNMW